MINLKPKKLSPKVISDLHRHVWWLINLRDGINHEAQQVQLCADIANLLAPYGIDATIHRHWTVPMNDNRVDVFLSYWEPGKMSASVASEIIEFHNVSDTLFSVTLALPCASLIYLVSGRSPGVRRCALKLPSVGDTSPILP